MKFYLPAYTYDLRARAREEAAVRMFSWWFRDEVAAMRMDSVRGSWQRTWAMLRDLRRA